MENVSQMRGFYIKMIGRYIESKQMRDYLIGVADELSKRQIIDLICGARAALRDKYESLMRLSELETDKEDSAYEKAQKAKKFLDELDWCYAYTVVPNGEIWFCRDIKNHEDNCFDDSQDLNLPVPFKIGDIITIDCRPFAPVKHGVIVEKGDNRGCCSVQCAWINEEGQVKTGALKHTTVFHDKSFVRVSPLYRAEVFDGELPHEERPLKEISEFVCREEENKKIEVKENGG